MDKVLIVTPSASGRIDYRVQRAWKVCESYGARQLLGTECSDVALARNTVLTPALELDPSRDVFLLLDDDIVAPIDVVLKLVGYARKTGRPASAAYGTQHGKFCATKLDWNPNSQRWMTGLGCCAIPRAVLKGYAETLPVVLGPDDSKLLPFTQSRYVNDHAGALRWCSEDYWFCRAIGGVDLLPLPVQHLKVVPIIPDAESVNEIIGEPAIAEKAS